MDAISLSARSRKYVREGSLILENAAAGLL
jgi:hypothetical protein